MLDHGYHSMIVWTTFSDRSNANRSGFLPQLSEAAKAEWKINLYYIFLQCLMDEHFRFPIRNAILHFYIGDNYKIKTFLPKTVNFVPAPKYAW